MSSTLKSSESGLDLQINGLFQQYLSLPATGNGPLRSCWVFCAISGCRHSERVKMSKQAQIAVIAGDGIGVDVTEAALAVANAALVRAGLPALAVDTIRAGAGCFRDTGQDIVPDGEARAGAADAIFLGAIGLPSVRHEDGTEISPHLRLRDRFELYAGVRPVRAYPNAPQRLADPRAAGIDLVILRESTEGLFYFPQSGLKPPTLVGKTFKRAPKALMNH